MYVGRDFSPQEYDESEVIGLDFVNDVEEGETLISSVWTIGVASGVDADASRCLEGPSMVIEPKGSTLKTGTFQRIGGLLPNVTYIVRARVTTSFGNTVSLWSHIRGVAPVTAEVIQLSDYRDRKAEYWTLAA